MIKKHPVKGMVLGVFAEIEFALTRVVDYLMCLGEPLKTKSVNGTLPEIYSYDKNNRITYIDYPDITPDVDIQYDKIGNKEFVESNVSKIDYGYDDNNNLKEELLTVGGQTFRLTYNYD